MIKIESTTLEEAYTKAAESLACSVTELNVEVVQVPSKGMLGLFKKNAIIVATKKQSDNIEIPKKEKIEVVEKIVTKTIIPAPIVKTIAVEEEVQKPIQSTNKPYKPAPKKQEQAQTFFQDTIMPQSFVSMQDEDEDTYYEPVYADEDDEEENNFEIKPIKEIAQEVKKELNKLFKTICFELNEIEVSDYDANTLLIEFRGEDAALLIGKEGYRYKALSYMLFNWINAKYQVGLRLEIAEFLKNQEEAVAKYLENVSEIVAKEGRAQTKILDGVLIQIALKELRDIYPDKYVAIRSTRDGLKYIIINDYHAK